MAQAGMKSLVLALLAIAILVMIVAAPVDAHKKKKAVHRTKHWTPSHWSPSHHHATPKKPVPPLPKTPVHTVPPPPKTPVHTVPPPPKMPAYTVPSSPKTPGHTVPPTTPPTVPHQQKFSEFYPGGNSGGLSEFFYASTCPGVEFQIHSLVRKLVAQDNTLPAAWTRLHFHDCFVHGCDASVLISASNPNSELNALPNAGSLRGFDLIDTIKAAVEKMCPGVVSCADILAIAARDSIQCVGGPYWPVPLGRRDGLVSLASAANAALPSPFSNYSQLVQNFAAMGLTAKDMVVLSGAHTIGFAHCGVFLPRLNGQDPTLDPVYAAQLQKECPTGAPLVPLDPTNGGQRFDSNYYTNLLSNKGLLISDATLITDPQGAAIVKSESHPMFPFFADFGAAMVKMGKINVLTGTQGEIRKVCSAFNS